MNSRNKTAQVLVVLAALVLVSAALTHCLAAYPGVAIVVSASNLSPLLQKALRACFLMVGWDWVVIAVIMLISAFTATKLRKWLVLFCGFALLVTATVALAFLGWFVGTDMIVASAVLSCGAGLLFEAAD